MRRLAQSYDFTLASAALRPRRSIMTPLMDLGVRLPRFGQDIPTPRCNAIPLHPGGTLAL